MRIAIHFPQKTTSRRIGLRSGQRITRTITLILLIVGSILSMIPLVWLVRSSFMNLRQMFFFPPQWIPDPWEWKNYPKALSSAPFLTYFLNTMKIMIPGMLGSLITSCMAAYSFGRMRWRGRDMIFGILYSTLLLPGIVTLIPTFVMWAQLNMVNSFFPLIIPAWFGGGIFNIFLLRQFFRSIPRDYDDSAKIDGANAFQILWYIIVPLARPALITICIFSFLHYWNDFIGPLIYLSSPEKYTLSIGLATFVGMYSSEWSQLMAASTVILVPVIIVFLIGQSYFVEGITLTGLKG